MATTPSVWRAGGDRPWWRGARVALVSLSGGDSAAWLASALAGQAADVHFLVPEGRAGYLAPDLGARVHVSALPLAPWHRPLRQAGDCRGVVRRVRELDPDVVHLQQGHHLFNLLLRAL